MSALETIVEDLKTLPSDKVEDAAGSALQRGPATSFGRCPGVSRIARPRFAFRSLLS